MKKIAKSLLRDWNINFMWFAHETFDKYLVGQLIHKLELAVFRLRENIEAAGEVKLCCQARQQSLNCFEIVGKDCESQVEDDFACWIELLRPWLDL